MTDNPNQIRFARRFVIRSENHPDIHGIEFPSGRVIFDDPDTGLCAATSVEHVTDQPHTIHWAEEQQQ